MTTAAVSPALEPRAPALTPRDGRVPFFGAPKGLIAHPARFLEAAAQDGPDFRQLMQRPYPLYFLNHPDMVKEVLVTKNREFRQGRFHEWLKLILGEGLLTSEGDFHLRQRRLVQPAFHRERIAGYGRVMAACADHHTAGWADSAEVNAAAEMMQLTLRIVVKTLFNGEVEGDLRTIGQAVTTGMEYTMSRALNPFGWLVHRLPTPSRRRFERARNVLDETIYGLIHDRMDRGEDTGDLLSMLIAAQDDATDNRRMSARQVRDEAMTLFNAGHETTANALSWTFYLLSKYPEAREKLHAELDAVLAGRLPGVDDLPALRYTEQVFTESMRLYPPAYTTSRIALHDVEIGGHQIPNGPR